MVKYTFVVADGPDLGRTFDLEPGVTLLGRLNEATPNDPEGSRRWTLMDKTVSRTHSEVSWAQPGAPLLTHLSATNDTYLDGRRIKEETLQPGQAIRMGQTVLIVQMEAEGRPVMRPSSDSQESKPSPTQERKSIKLTPNWASSSSGSGSSSQTDSGSWGGAFDSSSSGSLDLPDLGYNPTPMEEAPSPAETPEPIPERDDSGDSWAHLPTDTVGVDPFLGQSAAEPDDSYRLKFAEATDLDDLLLMMKECHRELNLDFRERHARAAAAALVDNSHLGLLWLMMAGDEQVGYLCLTFGFSLEFGGRDAFLDEVFVKREHRGQGLATGALVAALAEAKELDIKAVHLEVDTANHELQELYASQGFKLRENYFLMTRRL